VVTCRSKGHDPHCTAGKLAKVAEGHCGRSTCLGTVAGSYPGFQAACFGCHQCWFPRYWSVMAGVPGGQWRKNQRSVKARERRLSGTGTCPGGMAPADMSVCDVSTAAGVATSSYTHYTASSWIIVGNS
jgi:hypothetical protein